MTFSCSEKKKQSHFSLGDDLSPQMGIELSQLSMHGRKRKAKTQNLPLIDLGTIQNATSNFSHENKLGAGGFGVVYKVMIFPNYMCLNNLLMISWRTSLLTK